MKKFVIITLVVGLAGAASIGALAYRGGMSDNTPQNQMYGQRGGMMNNATQNQTYGPGMMNNAPQNQMYGPRGGMKYNNRQMPYGGRGGMRGGRGRGQQFNNDTAPWSGNCPYYNGAQGRAGQAPQASQMITEDKASEAANEFVAKYFPEYTVKSIEKDTWRPLYFATIQNADGAEQIMTVHGFSGQVMNIFPKAVEEPDAE